MADVFRLRFLLGGNNFSLFVFPVYVCLNCSFFMVSINLSTVCPVCNTDASKDPDIYSFILFNTEANHCGPLSVQRGTLPSFSWGAPWKHHQWRSTHGGLFVHTWWPQGAHCGWMQLCAPGSAGPPVWVYGQRKCFHLHHQRTNLSLPTCYSWHVNEPLIINILRIDTLLWNNPFSSPDP